jgi:hypothetical protein
MNNYGEFTVETGTAFDLSIYVSVTIGSQVFRSSDQSSPFHLVVFDCSNAITFVGIPSNTISLLVGETPSPLAVSASGTADCPVTPSSFAATGLAPGISMDVNG